MGEWRYLYKCRHCGAITEEMAVVGQDQMFMGLLAAITGNYDIQGNGIPVIMVSYHLCNPSQYGISDLIGGIEKPIPDKEA